MQVVGLTTGLSKILVRQGPPRTPLSRAAPHCFASICTVCTSFVQCGLFLRMFLSERARWGSVRGRSVSCESIQRCGRGWDGSRGRKTCRRNWEGPDRLRDLGSVPRAGLPFPARQRVS